MSGKHHAVGLTKPFQSLEQLRRECAGISGNEPVSPSCDLVITNFPEATPDDGRSCAKIFSAPVEIADA